MRTVCNWLELLGAFTGSPHAKFVGPIFITSLFHIWKEDHKLIFQVLQFDICHLVDKAQSHA